MRDRLPPAPWEPGAERHFTADPLDGVDSAACAGDGGLWSVLLTLAWHHAGQQRNGLFGVLRGLRASGARLTIESDGASLRVAPLDDLDESKLWAEFLSLHSGSLSKMLTHLSREYAQEVAQVTVHILRTLCV